VPSGERDKPARDEFVYNLMFALWTYAWRTEYNSEREHPELVDLGGESG
jgi:hypothetical protein